MTSLQIPDIFPQVYPFKYLPQTNCRECNCPTCLVLACRMAEGVKSPGDCPHLDEGSKQKLGGILSGFKFID